MTDLEIEDVLGAMNVKDVKVGMRVSLKSFTGKQVMGTVAQDQGLDNFFVELDDGSGENHHAAELTPTGAVVPRQPPSPSASSSQTLSPAEMKKQIVEGKAAMKSNPAQFKATLQMVFGLAGTSPLLVQSMVSAAAIDTGYVKDTIAVVKADAKMSKQWDAALKANPKEAAALQAALAKTEEVPSFFTKKFLKVPVWGWGTGGAGVLGLAAWLIWGRKRGR